MPLRSKIKRIIDTAVNFILITLAISVIVLGSVLPFLEQTVFLCMAIYILLRLKYGQSISELNYILSLLISIIMFYALKFGLLSSIFLVFYFIFISVILLSQFIIDRETFKVYLSPVSLSVGIICIFFYLISMMIKLNLSEAHYYLIPTFCLLVFLHLAIFRFKPEKSKTIGIIFAAVLVCAGYVFLFRYVSSAYLINKGSIEKAKGNITSALSDCKRSVSLLPFDARNHYMLALCYEAGGFKAEAIKEYQKIANNLGFRDWDILTATYVRLSELYLYNSQWQDTYMSLVKLVILKASNQFILAMSEPIKNLYDSILFEYKDSKKEAIEKIKTYLNFERCKDDDYSHYRLAKLYRACGEAGLAIHEYNEAVDRNPNEFTYRLDLACLYLVNGMSDKSIKQYSQLAEIRPDSFEALEGYVDALLSGGYRADALLIAEEIKKRYPDRIIVHEILAKVYSCNGFSEKALVEYKEFFKKTPVNTQTLRILGDYYLGNYEFEEALKTYLKVIKLNPDSSIRETIKMLRETDHKEFMQRELVSLENMSNQQPQDTSLLRKCWFLKRKLESYR